MKTISLISLLAVVLCTSVHADKITIDPYKNNGTAAKLEEPTGPDTRLNQKIAYTSKDKRLHSVLEELTKQTGVDIQTGKSKSDWPVRDIPVIVCVKDLPLGKLMRAIADATHLALTSSTAKGVKHYRIWRDDARQAQLDDYFADLEDAKNAKLGMQFDAWVKLKQKNIPDYTSYHTIGSDKKKLDMSETLRTTADVITALPPGSREAVLSGKVLSLDIKSASPQLAEALRAYYQSVETYTRALQAISSDEPDSTRKPLRDMTEADMEKMKFIVANERSYRESNGADFSDGSTDRFSDLMAELDRNASSIMDCEDFGSPVGGYQALGQVGEKNPVTALEPPATAFAPTMRKIDFWHCDLPGLEQKFKIPKPKAGVERTFADLVVDTANALGFSIVCEDFQSHHRNNVSDDFAFYDQETTLKALYARPGDTDTSSVDALEWENKYGHLLLLGSDWLANTDSKILVGWDQKWWEQHKSIAPEKTVADLTKKMDTDGISIDDAATLLLLPRDQYTEWIVKHKGFDYPGGIPGYDSPLWKLYAKLTPTQKSMAKSKDGLPLSKLKAEDVIAVFAQYNDRIAKQGDMGKLKAISNYTGAHPELAKRVDAWAKQYLQQRSNSGKSLYFSDDAEELKSLLESFPEARAAIEPVTDPARILSLKMFVVNEYFTGDRAARMAKYYPSGDNNNKPHFCKLKCIGDGIQIEAGNLGTVYPTYSAKRRAELMDAKKSETKSPQTNSQ